MHPGGSNTFPAVEGSHALVTTDVTSQSLSSAPAWYRPKHGSHTKTLKLGKLSSTLKSPGQGEDERARRSPVSRGGPGQEASCRRGREVGPAAWLTEGCGSDAWCSPALLWDHEVLRLLTSADGGCHVVPTLWFEHGAGPSLPVGGSDQGCSLSEAGSHVTENASQAHPEVIQALA